MSEYWVSHKKYLCKYCNIYIADDAPSRRQHETGLRHKGNVERFVRGLYKAGEKRKQDLEEEKREMARIEKAAGAAFAQDVSTGVAKAGSSSSPVASSSTAPSGPKTAPPKPSNPFANYSTAESLGFTDPDAERAKAEAERRRTQGVAGEWQVVEIVTQPGAQDDGENGEDGSEEQHGEPSAEVQTGQKRPADALAEEEDGRGWKLRRKTASVGLGELYDPLALPIKLKPKKEADEQTSSAGTATLGGSEKPKWSARGWNKPGTSSTTTTSGQEDGQEGMVEEDTKAENDPLDKLALVSEDSTEVKTEEVKAEPVEVVAPPPPPGGSLFKKRKAPIGGGGRGGRRI